MKVNAGALSLCTSLSLLIVHDVHELIEQCFREEQNAIRHLTFSDELRRRIATNPVIEFVPVKSRMSAVSLYC